MTGARYRSWVRRAAIAALDLVLPPRCPGCGTVIEEPGRFCAPCWGTMNFLGNGGCTICGQPVSGGTPGQACGACLADPPPIHRARAVVEYGPIARQIVMRLKYGRKVALAKTMAFYMRPLVDPAGGAAILVPVPLHRWRLWSRGFNQSQLVARELSRLGGWQVADKLIERTRGTAPLSTMGAAQRRRTVSGAFAPARVFDIKDRTVVLIDDVETTGATSQACAAALRRAGAGRIELVTFARVVRPRRVD